MKNLGIESIILLEIIGFTTAVHNAAWKRHKERFKKFYPSPFIDRIRERYWKRVNSRIRIHNFDARNGKQTFFMTLNVFADYSDVEKINLRSTIVDESTRFSKTKYITNSSVRNWPNILDYRENDCLSPVLDQGSCGSCWAFVASTVLEFFQCNKKSNELVLYSRQQLVSCDTNNFGCDGGFYVNGWVWAANAGGLCEDKDYPYTSKSKTIAVPCETTCLKENIVTEFKWTSADAIAIQNALFSEGPVAAALDATDNFIYYSEGVFDDKECTTTANHAVIIVGYGTSVDGTPYWIVQNTWGTSWGMNGYILVRRGVNMCGIESYCAVLTLKE
ncbi:uncharacterized protein LOC136025399 [Artemia franciscana]|uniref:Peptidase C1A papain C-terminal domain-containing protein n=1 Tax=Artemia franciscana TaxID=6661 RepID=A0AA88IV00_ARTSF|nr:hypothetical protein QYM36_007884 [Artemia franciscana]